MRILAQQAYTLMLLFQAMQVGLPTMGTTAHATRKIMRQVMTKELGARMNWCAQRGVKTGLVGYRHIVFGIAGNKSRLLYVSCAYRYFSVSSVELRVKRIHIEQGVTRTNDWFCCCVQLLLSKQLGAKLQARRTL